MIRHQNRRFFHSEGRTDGRHISRHASCTRSAPKFSCGFPCWRSFFLPSLVWICLFWSNIWWKNPLGAPHSNCNSSTSSRAKISWFVSPEFGSGIQCADWPEDKIDWCKLLFYSILPVSFFGQNIIIKTLLKFIHVAYLISVSYTHLTLPTIYSV